MASSTSHSESRVPWLAVGLLGAAVAAWLLGAAYTLWLNPETRFNVFAGQLKQAWARKLTQEQGAKVVIFGGSSCTFSIDGERLQQKFGLPTVNMGLSAGLGAQLLTSWAMSETKPGDTLIMALEPDLLTVDNAEHSLSAIQFGYAMGAPQWLNRVELTDQRLGRVSGLLALRPGGFYAFTLLGKLARGAELYRYKPTDFHASGWQETAVRMPINGPPGNGPHLSADSRRLLSGLRAWGQENHVRLAYSLPWGYTPEPEVARAQQAEIPLLLEISEYLPVLKDPRLGAYAVLEHYADTNWHLIPEGAALRTDALGAQLQKWDVWTREELQAWLAPPAARPP